MPGFLLAGHFTLRAQATIAHVLDHARAAGPMDRQKIKTAEIRQPLFMFTNDLVTPAAAVSFISGMVRSTLRPS